MVEYVLPDKQKQRIKEGYKAFLIAEEIQRKLALVGEPNAEAEAKIEALKAKARLYAEVFEIDLEEV